MSLLKLKNIGKIYTSEGNVAVGIRGVDLSFDKGEFVAVTGASGSGKSTLLNVISGMDTYEEGELYIEGSPTSHYLQSDWEEYREKYISFIFQDYNILESFTVLQNVELALMHIEDRKARRKRAVELLTRVGMADCLKRRGSKLSGGQKQRTVIARALAKDSPMILADEPTGNLDSKTSAEIIELLREVSQDKLLIVVTHNFDQVEHIATRHIRIFDGAVSFDRKIDDRSKNASAPDTEAETELSETENAECAPAAETDGKKDKKPKGEIKKLLRNGFTLGMTTFKATPKLTVFLCLLLVLGALAIFAITAMCGDSLNLFKKHYMFENIPGRVVLTRRDGEVMTEDEIAALCDSYGATDYMRYDVLLDEYGNFAAHVGADNNPQGYGDNLYTPFKAVCGADFGKRILGRYPTAANEVLLYLPISYRPAFGKNAITVNKIAYGGMLLDVVGIKYYYDNNKDTKILFTEDGLRLATYYRYICAYADCRVTLRRSDKKDIEYQGFVPSFDIAPDKIYIDSYETGAQVTVDAQSYGGSFWAAESAYYFSRTFYAAEMASVEPAEREYIQTYGLSRVYFGIDILRDIVEPTLSDGYRQASLFFDGNKPAKKAAERLADAGYIAVPSDTTYSPSVLDTISDTLSGVFLLVVWVCAVLFLAFFVSLCTRRAMETFKSDMAVMRSMGISVKTVRVSMYTRMLISLVPALAALLVAALVLYLTPALNPICTFLHAWQYVLIVLGMVLLTLRVTHHQIRRLFKTSVKKSLKGETK